jgi:tRNA threonylcarbamoyladenosine biosynthesis protein TsaB
MEWSGLTLVLDGSMGAISVALFAAGDLVGQGTAERATDSDSRGAAEQLPELVQSLLRALPRSERPHRVVVGDGPGSFTGLRTAAAFAKGMAHGGAIPMLAVPSLALLVGEALEAGSQAADGDATVGLDALRGEWYVQSFRCVAGQLREAGARRRELATSLPPHLVGPGRARDHAPHARAFGRCLVVARTVDPAMWEPDYGRLAEATVQRAAREAHAAAARAS